MKSIITILAALTLITANIIFAQTTYTWTGPNNGNWSTASNWNPSRLVGQTSDILLFDNGLSLTIQNVQQQTVGQIKVTNNTNIMLVPSAGNAKTISIQGCAGVDFLVETGSKFEIYSNDPKLGIYLKAGATASIYGSITLRGLQSHYINAQDSQSFVFHSGSVLTQKCSGSIFTNAGTANAIVFESGSKFVMADNSALNPFGLNAPSSKVIFSQGSLYVQQSVNPASFNLSGRIYSNVEIADNVEVSENISQNAELNNLTFTGQSSLTVNSTNQNNKKSLVINGDLNLGNAVLTVNNLNVIANGNVLRNNGYVIGKLSKNVTQQNPEVTFEVGAQEGYTPVTLNFNKVIRTGYVSVTSVTGFNKLLEDTSKSIKRYWSIESNELSCASYEASFKYLSVDFTNTFSETEELNMQCKELSHSISTFHTEAITKSIDTVNNILTAENIISFGDFAIVKNNTQIDGFAKNTAGVKETNLLPKEYSVSQNYPNPFNPSTKIDFALPFESKVTIKIFDISGKEISTIISETRKAGIHTVSFNASNLSSGIYFYHITALNGLQSFEKTMKMVMVK